MSLETVPAPQGPQAPVQILPAPLYRVLVLMLLAVTAGSAITLWLERSRYENFPGYLQARLRTVCSSREATISRILVTPGQAVSQGQPLVVLDDETFARRMLDRQHEVASLEIELARTQAALEVELDIQQRDISDRVFETKWRSAQLLRRHLYSPDEFLFPGPALGSARGWQASPTAGNQPPLPEEAMIQRASAENAAPGSPPGLLRISVAEMDLCTDHIRELEKMSRDLPDKIRRSMGIDLVEARLAHARAALAATEKEQSQLTLVAETAGLVGVFQKEAGDRVQAHEPIVQVLDEEQPYLVLQFPSPRIADFSPGTVVDLRFPGGRKGKGRVEEIPPQTSDMPSAPGAKTDTVVSAHIDPVGALWPRLPFGSVVEVRRKR